MKKFMIVRNTETNTCGEYGERFTEIDEKFYTEEEAEKILQASMKPIYRYGDEDFNSIKEVYKAIEKQYGLPIETIAKELYEFDSINQFDYMIDILEVEVECYEVTDTGLIYRNDLSTYER